MLSIDDVERHIDATKPLPPVRVATDLTPDNVPTNVTLVDPVDATFNGDAAVHAVANDIPLAIVESNCAAVAPQQSFNPAPFAAFPVMALLECQNVDSMPLNPKSTRIDRIKPPPTTVTLADPVVGTFDGAAELERTREYVNDGSSEATCAK